MKNLLSWLIVTTVLVSSTFAAGIEQIPLNTSIPSDAAIEKIGIPYYGNTTIKYEYDAKALKKIHDKNSSLIEVVCQSEDIFKNLWIQASSLKVNNIGFSKNGLDINVDAKNCSFYANRSVRTQSTQWTNDSQALASAQEFVQAVFWDKGIVSVPTLWKPIITWRDAGATMYPMLREASSDKGLAGITLIKWDKENEKIEVQYNSITILYPYVIGWVDVYGSFGNGKMGISITVDGQGINSVLVPLLAFKGIAKTAEKSTFEGMKKFIEQWWNNPYRGSNITDATVKLTWPERVLVYFDYYIPNATQSRKFISDGIKLGSSIKQDQRSQQPYEMVIADFVIGNNSNPILMNSAEHEVSDMVKKPTRTSRPAARTRVVK